MSETDDQPVHRDDQTPFRIGNWRVEPQLDEIVLDGRAMKLEPRTMRVLLALAREPGRLVTSEALLDQAWPNLTVTSNSLYQAVGDLRRVLGADKATPAFITTVSRRGYRLVAPVERAKEDERHTPAPGVARLGPRSVAILPFGAPNLPESHGFLAEVLLDDLIDEVSRHPAIVAIARGTMLTFAGRPADPLLVARDLGVGFVVEGRLLLAGEELRVSLRLIDGSGGRQVVAEETAFALADWANSGRLTMARAARRLLLELAEGAARGPPVEGGRDLRAVEIAMRAWVELYCRPQTPESNERAWRWAEEALALDPDSAVGLNALAFCEWRAAQYGWRPNGRGELLSAALDHAQRAIDLSPRNPDPYYTLALATFLAGDLNRAEAALRHCIGLNASYAPAHALLGLVRAALGFPEDADALCERSFALSPYEPLRAIWHWIAAWAAILLGEYDRALDQAQRGIAANPHFPTCYLAGIIAARRLGQSALAASYAQVLSRSPTFGTVADLAVNAVALRFAPQRDSYFADLAAAGLPERRSAELTASG
ncbi:MAG TPA: winged helix-turn-helix domain-containing protein [Bosea sp. (in: a-proteobacteria)]|jgi:DNA-binding winged helix-turn-helix (wHTH) protein|nr:winged helix-turn-helix domain-containing protein [Bosea sp. (in: a-proteobacteria)]